MCGGGCTSHDYHSLMEGESRAILLFRLSLSLTLFFYFLWYFVGSSLTN